MSIESWLLFSSIALVATITPGPAVLLVTSHSLTQGLWRSIATILGNITGLFSMSLASVLGLSTLILLSADAFMVLKAIGALYLIYLGVRLWRNGFHLAPQTSGQSPAKSSLGSLYLQGLLVSLTNPKAIAFTTALFPQFIDAGSPLALQFSILVATFTGFSFFCLLGYGWMAHRAKSRASRLVSSALLGKVFGGAFVGSGLLLASSGQR